MFGFIWVYSEAGAPGVKYPVIIGQFLGANGLGNGFLNECMPVVL